MKHSKVNKLSVSAAALVFAVGTVSPFMASAASKDTEKCYGVAAAGKNDCSTATSSCAGTSKKDRQGDAWIKLPKGTCKKIVGGSLSSKK